MIDLSAWFALALMIVAGLLLVLRHDAGSIAGLDASDFAVLVAGVALLIFIGLPLLGSYRGRITSALRDFATWGAMALVLIAAYSYRAELVQIANRVAGELLPAGTELSVGGRSKGQAAVRIRRRADGHFVARAAVNGVVIKMLVDTGASAVILRPIDARRIGIDFRNLTYAVPVQTANGTSFAARVRLRNVAVGPIGIVRVEALVARPGALNQSLLGMSFLSRLRSYEFSGDFLTLRG